MGCDFWVLATESVVGGSELKVVLREQSRVYSVPVGKAKCLFLSVVPPTEKRILITGLDRGAE